MEILPILFRPSWRGNGGNLKQCAVRLANRDDKVLLPVDMLVGEVFRALQDLKMFNSVELDTRFGTVQWPNGADFDPETLHDWPKYREELVAMARRWATAADSVRRTTC
jgi:hypothetical protein